MFASLFIIGAVADVAEHSPISDDIRFDVFDRSGDDNSVITGGDGEFPPLNATRFLVTYNSPWSGFMYGDQFVLDGKVSRSGGHAVARNIVGGSPDHEIVFGKATCSDEGALWCHWPLRVIIDGNVTLTEGLCGFGAPDGEFFRFDYGLAVLTPGVSPPFQKFPPFNASLYKIFDQRSWSGFVYDDYFMLDGEVGRNGGHAVAKNIIGGSPDHEIVFGNVTCGDEDIHACHWPLRVIIDGNVTLTQGQCWYYPDRQEYRFDYGFAGYERAAPPCEHLLNETPCTGFVAGMCSWCVSKDHVHALCFQKSNLPDVDDWDCGGAGVTVI